MPQFRVQNVHARGQKHQVTGERDYLRPVYVKDVKDF